MENKLTDEQILDAIAAERTRQYNLIRKQNDEFRTTWGACIFTVPGDVLYTPSVTEKGGAFMSAAMAAVMTFDDFNEQNDLYGVDSG